MRLLNVRPIGVKESARRPAERPLNGNTKGGEVCHPRQIAGLDGRQNAERSGQGVQERAEYPRLELLKGWPEVGFEPAAGVGYHGGSYEERPIEEIGARDHLLDTRDEHRTRDIDEQFVRVSIEPPGTEPCPRC